MIFAYVFVIFFFAIVTLVPSILIGGIYYRFLKDAERKEIVRRRLSSLLRILAFCAYVEIISFIFAVFTKDPASDAVFGFVWSLAEKYGGTFTFFLFVLLWVYFDGKIGGIEQRISGIESKIDDIEDDIAVLGGNIREDLSHVRNDIRNIWDALTRK